MTSLVFKYSLLDITILNSKKECRVYVRILALCTPNKKLNFRFPIANQLTIKSNQYFFTMTSHRSKNCGVIKTLAKKGYTTTKSIDS